MGYKPALSQLVADLMNVVEGIAKGHPCVFVCAQGKDRSVLMCRAVMEFMGHTSIAVGEDTLWLTSCCLE